MAKKYKGKMMSFAIANKAAFQKEIDDWKLDQSADVLVVAKNAKSETFLLADEPFR